MMIITLILMLTLILVMILVLMQTSRAFSRPAQVIYFLYYACGKDLAPPTLSLSPRHTFIYIYIYIYIWNNTTHKTHTTTKQHVTNKHIKHKLLIDPAPTRTRGPGLKQQQQRDNRSTCHNIMKDSAPQDFVMPGADLRTLADLALPDPSELISTKAHVIGY